MTAPTYGFQFNRQAAQTLPAVVTDMSSVYLVGVSEDATPSILPLGQTVWFNSNDPILLANMGTGDIADSITLLISMPTKAVLRCLQREEEAARAQWLADEKIRVMRQRVLWQAIPDGEAKAALRKAMLDQAWRLLDAAQGEACDALLEFLPEADQDRLLREFFPEQYA